MRSRKISKRTREQAILLCELTGNLGVDWGCGYAWCADVQFLIDLPHVALLAAVDARWSVADVIDDPEGNVRFYALTCLEAAALLRDGWSPGDPVVRL